MGDVVAAALTCSCDALCRRFSRRRRTFDARASPFPLVSASRTSSVLTNVLDRYDGRGRGCYISLEFASLCLPLKHFWSLAYVVVVSKREFLDLFVLIERERLRELNFVCVCVCVCVFVI